MHNLRLTFPAALIHSFNLPGKSFQIDVIWWREDYREGLISEVFNYKLKQNKKSNIHREKNYLMKVNWKHIFIGKILRVILRFLGFPRIRKRFLKSPHQIQRFTACTNKKFYRYLIQDFLQFPFSLHRQFTLTIKPKIYSQQW